MRALAQICIAGVTSAVGQETVTRIMFTPFRTSRSAAREARAGAAALTLGGRPAPAAQGLARAAVEGRRVRAVPCCRMPAGAAESASSHRPRFRIVLQRLRRRSR